MTVSLMQKDEMILDNAYYDLYQEAKKIYWIVKITDFGAEMTKHELKRSVEISTLTSILKAMGGRVDMESCEKETSFIYKFACL